MLYCSLTLRVWAAECLPPHVTEGGLVVQAMAVDAFLACVRGAAVVTAMPVVVVVAIWLWCACHSRLESHGLSSPLPDASILLWSHLFSSYLLCSAPPSQHAATTFIQQVAWEVAGMFSEGS
jgi:hypothetical protein